MVTNLTVSNAFMHDNGQLQINMTLLNLREKISDLQDERAGLLIGTLSVCDGTLR